MFSEGMGWPHFAQACPASNGRFVALSLPVPNSFAKNPTVPPLLEWRLMIEGCTSF